MQVKDSAGKTLYDRGVPLEFSSDDGTKSIGQFAIPSKGLNIYVIGPASGQVDPDIKAGQIQLEIHKTGTKDPIATEIISQGQPTTVAGQHFTFERTRQFTGLIVARDHGAIVVWIGSGLLVLGLVMVFFFPHRRVWVRIRTSAGGGSQILCAATMRRDPAFEPRFHELVTDIQLAANSSNDTPSTTSSTTQSKAE
jgi:cytochrome c biogenesis protein